MLKDAVIQLYHRLRMGSYRIMFGSIHEKSGSLSATEAFSADMIGLMGTPTVTQFAEAIGISQPNATYKINSLVAKGYLTKEVSETDKREVRLHTAGKFHNYFNESYADMGDKIEELRAQFSDEELKTAEKVLFALVAKLEAEEK